MKTCPNCGSAHQDNANFCNTCGASLHDSNQTPPPYGYYRPDNNNAFDPSGPEGKSRGVAGLLAILLGGFGAHYFYVGKIAGGFLTILLTFITCGLWDILIIIQGFLFFCMSNSDFQRKYVESTSTLPLF